MNIYIHTHICTYIHVHIRGLPHSLSLLLFLFYTHVYCPTLSLAFSHTHTYSRPRTFYEQVGTLKNYRKDYQFETGIICYVQFDDCIKKMLHLNFPYSYGLIQIYTHIFRLFEYIFIYIYCTHTFAHIRNKHVNIRMYMCKPTYKNEYLGAHMCTFYVYIFLPYVWNYSVIFVCIRIRAYKYEHNHIYVILMYMCTTCNYLLVTYWYICDVFVHIH